MYTAPLEAFAQMSEHIKKCKACKAKMDKTQKLMEDIVQHSNNLLQNDEK